MQLKYVPLRTRRAQSLYKASADRALCWFSMEHCGTAITPFWHSAYDLLKKSLIETYYGYMFCFTGLPQREVDGPTTPTRPKPNGATRKRRATEAVRRTAADARTRTTRTDRGATRARRREGLTDAPAQEAETGQRYV